MQTFVGNAVNPHPSNLSSFRLSLPLFRLVLLVLLLFAIEEVETTARRRDSRGLWERMRVTSVGIVKRWYGNSAILL